MERIKFYYEGSLVGQAPLPEFTDSKARLMIAKGAGVAIYDEMEFMKANGEVRAHVTLEKYPHLSNEFNIET